MAGYISSASSYVEIADSSTLNLVASPGWTFSGFVAPDSGLIQNTFGYIYAHDQPLNTVPAVAIIRGGGGSLALNAMRFILDWAGGNLIDFTTTTALFTSDAWNRFIISYSAGNLTISINGVQNSTSGPALPDIDPVSVARIGYSTHGGARDFPGSIAHMAKWSRAWSAADALAFSSTWLSPEFAQNSLDWHIPMFTGASWDRQGNLSTTNVGMSWAPHGPFIYPSKSFIGLGSGVVAAGDDTYRYYRTA